MEPGVFACFKQVLYQPVSPALIKLSMKTSPLKKPIESCQDYSEGKSTCHAILIESDLQNPPKKSPDGRGNIRVDQKLEGSHPGAHSTGLTKVGRTE